MINKNQFQLETTKTVKSDARLFFLDLNKIRSMYWQTPLLKQKVQREKINPNDLPDLYETPKTKLVLEENEYQEFKDFLAQKRSNKEDQLERKDVIMSSFKLVFSIVFCGFALVALTLFVSTSSTSLIIKLVIGVITVVINFVTAVIAYQFGKNSN